MIVKGGSRSSAAYWSKHLMRTDHNEAVEILEAPLSHAFAQQSLYEGLRQFQDLAKLTAKGEKGLYCLHIDPDGKYTMQGQDWQTALAIAVQELGYEGQPRYVVKHTKDGRDHIHAILQRARYDERTREWTLIPDSWNYKKHEFAARKMEKALGHEHVKGVFTGRDRDPETGLCLDERPIAEMNHKDWQQAERTGKDPKAIKAEIAALWRDHKEDAARFKAALEQAGYRLARGDEKPIHMVVDRDGEAYDLRRSLKAEGVKKKELEERLAAYPAKKLETVAAIREAIRTRQEQRRPEALPEDLQARFAKSSAGQQGQVIDLEAERPQRRESKVEEARQQGKEIAEPQQAHTAVIAISADDAANDDRQQQKQDALEREIVEPRQRLEDLQAAFERQAQAVQIDETAQIAAIEADREAYEEQLRTEKRKERIVDKTAELEGIRNAITLRQLDDTRDMEARHARQNALKEAELAPVYGNNIKKLEKSIAAARERLEHGGFLYGLIFAGGDRRTIARETAELENAKWREDEAWQPLRNEQREERERMKKAQADELRRTDVWIRGQMEEFERSLTPARTQDASRDRSHEAPAQSQTRTRGGDGGGRRRTLAPVPYF